MWPFGFGGKTEVALQSVGLCCRDWTLVYTIRALPMLVFFCLVTLIRFSGELQLRLIFLAALGGF